MVKRPVVHLLIMGPPGAGKGTQSRLLREQPLNSLHLAIGDIMRSQVYGSPAKTSQKIKTYLDRGELVPDPLILKLLTDYLSSIMRNVHFDLIIWDGFPRSISQAQWLEKYLHKKGWKINGIVWLKIDHDQAQSRILHRITCLSCGFLGSDSAITQSKTCPECGLLLMHRSDDNKSTFVNRLHSYQHQTQPLFDYFQSQTGVVLKVLDANQSRDSLYDKIKKIILSLCKNIIHYLVLDPYPPILHHPNSLHHHLLIGENYYSLQNLMIAGYHKQIDIIYTEPPDIPELLSYQGNQKQSHLFWKIMMKKYKPIHDLLKEDGIIMISINPDRSKDLEKVIKCIWSKAKLVTTVCIPSSSKKDQACFIYHNSLQNPDHDPNGRWCSIDPTIKIKTKDANINSFTIKNPLTSQTDQPPPNRQWQFTRSKLKEYIFSGKIKFLTQNKSGQRGFIFKRYESEIKARFDFRINSKTRDSDQYTQQQIYKLYKEFNNNKDLPFHPQSFQLVSRLISAVSHPNALVLDFFAGSGTTGHAVLESNHRDGGQRQFILCTNNENNIAEFCYERIYRIMTGKTTKGSPNVALLNNQKPYGGRMSVYRIWSRTWSPTPTAHGIKTWQLNLFKTWQHLNPDFPLPDLQNYSKLLEQLQIKLKWNLYKQQMGNQLSFKLNNQVMIPAVGFGAWQLSSPDGLSAKQILLSAIETGYRLFDLAFLYKVHQDYKVALAESKIPRNQMFIVSKIWNVAFSSGTAYQKTHQQFCQIIQDLGVSSLDLLLLHMPYKNALLCWKAFEELYQQGLVRAIGVCNFNQVQLMSFCSQVKIKPMVLQTQIAPRVYPVDVIHWCQKNNIVVMGWGTIGRNNYSCFKIPLITKLAQKYHVDPPHIALRWLIQKKIVIIPSSRKPDRIKANWTAINNFELLPLEMKQIDNLPASAPYLISASRVKDLVDFTNPSWDHR